MMWNKEDFLVSIRRTLVPIVIGAVAASFVGPYVDAGSLNNVVSGVISAVYYSVVRWAEMYKPSFGFLLGARKTPIYIDSKA